MPDELPRYYFRHRDNGASVFRIDPENRQRRLELDEIAHLNIKNGQIKAHGTYVLTAEDHAAIDAWMAQRQATLSQREDEAAQRLIEEMNLLTQWLQSKASPAQIDALGDELLLAMHDLRSVLIRKKSDALSKAAP